MMKHTDCDHPATKAGRSACRKANSSPVIKLPTHDAKPYREPNTGKVMRVTKTPSKTRPPMILKAPSADGVNHCNCVDSPHW